MAASPQDYALRVVVNVKKTGRMAGLSRVTSRHQITIPIAAFSDAGLREGDVVLVEAQGPGRVVVSRMDDLIDECAGTLHRGGRLGRTVRSLRREWD